MSSSTQLNYTNKQILTQSTQQLQTRKQSSSAPVLAKVIKNNSNSIAEQNSSHEFTSDECLSVEINDVVCILDDYDANNYLAKFDQQQGKFPKSACLILDNSIPKQLCQYLLANNYDQIYACFASFSAQDTNDLSITKGDIIVVISQSNDHWLNGQLCYNGISNTWLKLSPEQQIGTFPMNHCWQFDSERFKALCVQRTKELTMFQTFLHKSEPKITAFQQDKLKSWLHSVKKKTSRLSTRITASLGLISLPRDEEFEHQFENLKHIEKIIRSFMKDVSNFVEHFESFLASLQSTSESIATFYRDKSNQREIDELRKKNKTVSCEHFYIFKRTIEKQVIVVIHNLLQKFIIPINLADKRLAKLIDFENKKKKLESCRDVQKRIILQNQQTIAQDAYEKINSQLKNELPIFNQTALDIFKQCALVLLECRKNLVDSYSNQTANLLDTPTMSEYSVDLMSKMFMSDVMENFHNKHTVKIGELYDKVKTTPSPLPMLSSNQMNTDEVDNIRQSVQSKNSRSSTHGSKSLASQLSNDFELFGVGDGEERSSTPLTVSSGGEIVNRKERPHISSDDERSEDTNGLREDESDNESIDNEGAGKTKPTATSNNANEERVIGEIYVASWPFIANGPTQLSLAFNQQVKLLKNCDAKGNKEWSLVEDRRHRTGYVPSLYIKKKVVKKVKRDD